jgi:hypothetical protein
MLDFTFESPTRVSLVEQTRTARAAVDRRAAAKASQPAVTPPRKRRRHDGLYSGKPAPLDW